MKHLIVLILSLWSLSVYASNPVPKDQANTPVYIGTGRPYFSEATTLTTTSYVALFTLPSTSQEDKTRTWRGLAVYNPSISASVYICLGDSTSCSTDMMKVPPSLGLVLDQTYFGPLNSVTTVWGKLSTGGSVVPEVTVW